MVRNSKTYHAICYTEHTGSLTVLMENMNTVPVNVGNKQMFSVGNDIIIGENTLKRNSLLSERYTFHQE